MAHTDKLAQECHDYDLDGNPLNQVGYVGKRLPSGYQRELTDWHGRVIGVCMLTSSWAVRSYIGSRMYQIYATIDGVRYTGRGFGEGMSVNLRKLMHQ